MRVGVPREVKDNEFRVAITPSGVHELTGAGHEVVVERDAGAGSSLPDADFVAAGAKILDTADDVWATADLVCKVKEPVAEEYHRMRRDQVLFTYLHLAASAPCTHAIISSGITAISYETVQLADGSLPLLAPMSEVAGRMAPQVGAHHLQRDGGGRGVLMGGVSGTYAAKVVVLGAGVSGMNAAAIALGMQAEVLLLDKNIERLRQADRIYQGHLQTVASNSYEIERAVLVDIAVDQGGCFESTRPTTHSDPTFMVHDALFYCVANMPGAVPHTSTYALTNVTMPYAERIAGLGWQEAVRRDPALALGVNVVDSEIVYPPVAEAHGMASRPLAEFLH
jgi:alanine dehydrogenase